MIFFLSVCETRPENTGAEKRRAVHGPIVHKFLTERTGTDLFRAHSCPVPEIIDPVFAKTSPNARFQALKSEIPRFGLVLAKTGSTNSVTGQGKNKASSRKAWPICIMLMDISQKMLFC